MQDHIAAEGRRNQFYRWCGPGLFAIGTVVSGVVAPALMTVHEMYVGGAVALVALLEETRWFRIRDERPLQGRAAQSHYWIRTALTFVLTWLNPLYALYAYSGYFDSWRMLPRRRARAGLLVNALTIAGSESGGLPPPTTTAWTLFAALFVVNACLSLFMTRLAEHEMRKSNERKATIEQLATTNARLEQALQDNEALQAQLLVQAREAGVADERRRLAAEIHDTLAQGLIGIIAQLQAAAAADRAKAREHLERASALARHSLGEARRSVQNLSPLDLEGDALPQALEKTVTAWSERTSVPAGFTVTGDELPLPDAVAATLLRIGQEALANVDKHARAGRVGVTLSYMDDEVSLDVRDDGLGFDPGDLPPAGSGGGFGLAGMRARAERIAGGVTVESEEGQGTAVSARVPLARHG